MDDTTKMILDRRRFLQLGSSSIATGLIPSTFAETSQRPPIIDVHLHAYPLDAPIPAATNPATGKTVKLKDGAAHWGSLYGGDETSEYRQGGRQRRRW